MYLENPDGITWRVKKVLAVALGKKRGDERMLPTVSPTEARQRGLGYIATIVEGNKKERMTRVFDLYMGGMNTKELAAAAKVSNGTASNYLNEIEKAVDCQIVRGRTEAIGTRSWLGIESNLLQEEREVGKRRASVRDFHSFRVTWVTLALTSGVPLELVQKVTGHKTTDIVLKHYFQPGREEFRRVLSVAMPSLLTSDSSAGRPTGPGWSAKEQMRAILEHTTSTTWEQERLRLLELLERL
jgi:hypothetical protein